MLAVLCCHVIINLTSSVHEGSQSTFSRVFELEQADLKELDIGSLRGSGSLSSPPPPAHSRSRVDQGRFPVNVGITGYVATTGETVNIRDAGKDSR